MANADPCANVRADDLLDNVSSYAIVPGDMKRQRQFVRRTMPFYSYFFDLGSTIDRPQQYYRDDGKKCYPDSCKDTCDNNLYPRRVIIKDKVDTSYRNRVVFAIPLLTMFLVFFIMLYYQYVALTRASGVSDEDFKAVYGERKAWYGWTMAATWIFILCFVPTIAVVYENIVLKFGQKWLIADDNKKVSLVDRSDFKSILWRALPFVFGLGCVIMLMVIISFRSVSSSGMKALLGINIALFVLVGIVLFLRNNYPSTKSWLSFSSGVGFFLVFAISITVLGLMMKYHPLTNTD